MAISDAVDGVLETIHTVLSQEMFAAFHDRQINTSEAEYYRGQIDALTHVAGEFFNKIVVSQMVEDAERDAELELSIAERSVGGNDDE